MYPHSKANDTIFLKINILYLCFILVLYLQCNYLPPYLDLLGQKGWLEVGFDHDLDLHFLTSNFPYQGNHAKWQANVLGRTISGKHGETDALIWSSFMPPSQINAEWYPDQIIQ